MVRQFWRNVRRRKAALAAALGASAITLGVGLGVGLNVNGAVSATTSQNRSASALADAAAGVFAADGLSATVEYGQTASFIQAPQDPRFPAANWSASVDRLNTNLVTEGPDASLPGQTGLYATIIWTSAEGQRADVRYPLEVTKAKVQWTDHAISGLVQLFAGQSAVSLAGLPAASAEIDWANAAWQFVPEGSEWPRSYDSLASFDADSANFPVGTIFVVSLTAGLKDESKYEFANGRQRAVVTLRARIAEAPAYAVSIAYGQDVSQAGIPADVRFPSTLWTPTVSQTNYVAAGANASRPGQAGLSVSVRWDRNDGGASRTVAYPLSVRKALVDWNDPQGATLFTVPYGQSPASVVAVPSGPEAIDWANATWTFSDDRTGAVYNSVAAFVAQRFGHGSSFTLKLTARLKDETLYALADGAAVATATFRLVVANTSTAAFIDKTESGLAASVRYGQSVYSAEVPADPDYQASGWTSAIDETHTNYAVGGSTPGQTGLYVTVRWTRANGSQIDVVRYALTVKKAVIAWTDTALPGTIDVPYGKKPKEVVVPPSQSSGIDWAKATWQFRQDGPSAKSFDSYEAFVAANPSEGSFAVTVKAPLFAPALQELSSGLNEATLTAKIRIIEGFNDQTGNRTASVAYGQAASAIQVPNDPAYPADKWTARVDATKTNYVANGSVPGQTGLYATIVWTANDGSATQTVRYGLAVAKAVIAWTDQTVGSVASVPYGTDPSQVIKTPTTPAGIDWANATWVFTPENGGTPIVGLAAFKRARPEYGRTFAVTVSAKVANPDLQRLSSGSDVAVIRQQMAVTTAYADKSGDASLGGVLRFNDPASAIALTVSDPQFPRSAWAAELLTTDYVKGVSRPGQAGLTATIRWISRQNDASFEAKYAVKVLKGLIAWTDVKGLPAIDLTWGQGPDTQLDLTNELIDWANGSWNIVTFAPGAPIVNSLAAFSALKPDVGTVVFASVKAKPKNPELYELANGAAEATIVKAFKVVPKHVIRASHLFNNGYYAKTTGDLKQWLLRGFSVDSYDVNRRIEAVWLQIKTPNAEDPFLDGVKPGDRLDVNHLDDLPSGITIATLIRADDPNDKNVTVEYYYEVTIVDEETTVREGEAPPSTIERPKYFKFVPLKGEPSGTIVYRPQMSIMSELDRRLNVGAKFTVGEARLRSGYRYLAQWESDYFGKKIQYTQLVTVV